MKNRVLIIALSITIMATFSNVPQAKADPLTIMAIVGVAAVLSASTVDMTANHHEDSKDFRARKEESQKVRAEAAIYAPKSTSGKVAVSARQD